MPECGIAAALGSRQFTGHGHVERVATLAVPVVRPIASRLADRSHLLGGPIVANRDFHREVFGPDLGMPHMRAMGGGLFELRLKAAEGIARIFYCAVIGRRILFLHQFIKKTDETPCKELEIARQRMRHLKDG